MAGSVNKVILIGHCGKDPEIRTTQSGSRVANFSMATSESWKDKATGERKENTQWHRITVWNDGIVGVIERFVKKGSKLYVEGMLETRKWTDNDGVDRYSTEVVLKPYNGSITLLDSPRNEAAESDPQSGYDESRRGSLKDSYQAQQPAYTGDLDDDIPF